MLSIGAMRSGQGFYYAALAREDYYLEGGEPPGRWHGGAARKICLDSNVMGQRGVPATVDPHTLHHVMLGYDALGRPLVQNAGREGKGGRQAGLDLTFTPDKSASVLREHGGAEWRRWFDKAQDYAVKKTLDFAEQKIGWVRRGRGGEEHVRAQLLFALFDHDTSRCQDVNQHTHALLMNVGLDADGQTRALYNKEFYNWKLALGVYYRAAYAEYVVHQMGLAIDTDRERGFYRIRGIYEDLCDAHSTRRKQIERELEEHGYSTARAADLANYRTRKHKGHLPRDVLKARFDQTLADLGHTEQAQQQAVRDAARAAQQEQAVRRETPARVAQAEAHRLAAECATFGEQDLFLAVQRRFVDGLSPDIIADAVSAELASARVVELGGGRRMPLYTSRDNLTAERSLFETATSLAEASGHTVRPATVERLLERYRHEHFTSDERVRAFEYLTRSPGDLKVLSGIAGSAKTSLLSVVREALESEGYNVLGMATAARAARGLQNTSGIESTTIARRLIQFERATQHRVLNNLTIKPLRDQVTLENLKDNLMLKPLREHLSAERLKQNLLLKPLLERLSPQQMVENLSFKRLREHFTVEQIRHNLSVQGWAEQTALGRRVLTQSQGMGRNSKPNAPLSRRGRSGIPDVQLDHKTVLVIDEATMVDTPRTRELLNHARAAGAMVVMVAGHGQLPPVKGVSPVRALQQHIGGGLELKAVLRQQHEWMRQAVRLFDEGDVRGGLSLLLQNNCLHLGHGGYEATKQKLVDHWMADVVPVSTRGVFVGTNADRIDFNQRIQQARHDAGELGGRSVSLASGERAFVGDTVMFLKNNDRLNVDNGTMGRVVAINQAKALRFADNGQPIPGHGAGQVTIQTEGGQTVRVNLEQYPHVTLGYAFTTHKGQGETVQSSYIYTTPRDAGREKIYVQASRHAESIHVYSPGHHQFEDLAELSVAMQKEHTRRLATEIERDWQAAEEERRRKARLAEAPGLERSR